MIFFYILAYLSCAKRQALFIFRGVSVWDEGIMIGWVIRNYCCKSYFNERNYCVCNDVRSADEVGGRVNVDQMHGRPSPET